MGAGASTLPPTIDKATAKTFAGDEFDEAAFDREAIDGVVSREAFLKAAGTASLPTADNPPNLPKPSGGPFVDDAFPPDAKALGMTPAEVSAQGITWRRASEVFLGAPLMPPGKPGHDIVVQGALNDCYVAATLALVASVGELTSLVECGEVEGQFVVTLFAGAGEKRVVIVDDQIPVSQSGLPLYAHAREGACLAIPLIEKALAKHYGSFAVLGGGNTSEALWDLTGCAVEDVKVDGDGASKLSPSACATLVGDALKRGDLVACGHIDVKKRGDYAAVCEGGVRMNHAFAVVGASAKEAKVYNPMGVDDGYTNGKTDGAGTLTMPWSEFTKSFTRLQVCRRSSRGALPSHKTWRSGEGGKVLSWRAGLSGGGCTNFASFRRNPMLRLPCGDGEAKRKATIEAVIGQRDRRGDTDGKALSYPQLGMCIVRLKEGASWPCVTAEHFEVVAKSSAFWNKREAAATLEVDLAGSGGSGGGEMYLVPSTYHPEEAGDFWLSVRSDVAIDAAEWVGAEAARPSAVWKGDSAKNTVRLGVAGAAAGRLCVFVRQTTKSGETTAAEKRVPLGVYLMDGDTVLQKAEFCKAGEMSVSFALEEAVASSAHLAVAPCTFAADKGAALEVEVMMPDAPSATALQLNASSGADPRTLSSAGGKTAASGEGPLGGATPAGKAGAKAKGPEKGKKKPAKGSKGAGGGAGDGMNMMGAKVGVMGLADLYGGLE